MNFYKIIESEDNHHFIRFNKQVNVIDLGYHEGSFETSIKENYSSYEYIGVEANPIFKPKHKAKIFNYCISEKSNEIVNFYLSEVNTMASSQVFKNEKSKLIQVKTISLKDLYNSSGFKFVEILKIDIEGSEFKILTQDNIKFLAENTAQVIVEFDDWIDKKLEPEKIKVINWFKENNFFYIQFSYFDSAKVLFLNKNFIKVGIMRLLYLYLFKYINGIRRILLRKFNFFESRIKM